MENMFPSVVLRRIFYFLDGKSLLACSKVCTAWEDEALSFFQRESFWERRCMMEIKSDVLLDIKNNLYPGSDLPIKQKVLVDWRNVYETCDDWEQLNQVHANTKQIYGGQGHLPVTCICISGNYMATGHRNGDVCLFNIFTSCRFVGYVAKHMRKVNALALFNVEGQAPDEDDDEPDFAKHDLIISTSSDGTILVNDLLGFQDRAAVPQPLFAYRDLELTTSSIKVYGNKFAVLFHLGIYLWKWDFGLKKFQLMMRYPRSTYDMHTPILGLSLWIDQIALVTLDNKVLSCSIEESAPLTPFVNWTENSVGPELGKMVMSCYMWRNWVNAFIYGDKTFEVCINGDYARKSYNTMHHLKSHPVCLTLYGKALLMGMDSGSVYIFRNEDIHGLLNLDLGKPMWSSSFGSEPINQIEVSESKDGPRLIVASQKSIHLVRFFPRPESR